MVLQYRILKLQLICFIMKHSLSLFTLWVKLKVTEYNMESWREKNRCYREAKRRRGTWKLLAGGKEKEVML